MEEDYDTHVEAVKLLSKAEEEFRVGRFESSREYLNESVALDPTLGRAWEIMGMVDVANGDFDSAMYNFQTALDCEGYSQMAEIAKDIMESSKWPQGDDESLVITKMTMMGEMFLKDRMWEAATACFLPLLDMVEADWRLLSVLGLINREMGELESSARFYRDAAQDPESPPEILSDLSVTLVKMGELDEAEEIIRSVLEKIDSIPQIWNNLGTVREAKGDLDDALSAYETALEIDERYYPAIYSLGRIFQKKGEMERAKEYMEKALSIEGRVYDLKDVSSRAEREQDDRIHIKEVMTPVGEDMERE